MQIPQDLLKEANYEGPRLIEITDEEILALQAKIKAFGAEAKPFLEQIDPLTKKLDPFYKKIGELRSQRDLLDKQIKEIHEQMAEDEEPYKDIVDKLESIQRRADNVKAKVIPLAMKFVEGQLGEFEKATQLIEKGDKLFVEVVDEIEEKVKAVRAIKASR